MWESDAHEGNSWHQSACRCKSSRRADMWGHFLRGITTRVQQCYNDVGWSTARAGRRETDQQKGNRACPLKRPRNRSKACPTLRPT